MDDALNAVFPELNEHRPTGGTDLEGWRSGLVAADRADLGVRTPVPPARA